MKSFSALFFLLACAGWTRADRYRNEVETALNRDFAPCNNFYKHVCDFNNPVFEKFNSYRGSYLVKEIAQLLPADDDVVVRRITQAFQTIRDTRDPATVLFERVDKRLDTCRFRNLKTSKTSNLLYARGKLIGELAAYGRADPYYIMCRSKYSCRISQSVTEAQFELLYSKSGEFIRGVFDAYFDALNITFNHDISILQPIATSDDIYNRIVFFPEYWFPAITSTESSYPWETMTVEERHVVFLSRQNYFYWFPYLNVLYAQMIYAHPEKFHPEVVDEFERLAMKIVDEICAAIESSDWMKPKSRRRLSRRIRGLKIEIAIPKHHRNLKHLTELLEVYRKAVAKVSNVDHGFCEIEMIARAVTAARNRLIFMRQKNGTIDFNAWGVNNKIDEQNIFASDNLLYYNGRILAWPTIIYPLYGNYSLGFKYGLVGSIIAHEIFHFLGLNEKLLPHIARIAETPHYSEMRECYYDYYGRITCADDGKECPDGKQKAHEGYCDVEGNRIAYRVLMKALNQSSYRNRAKRNSEIDEFPLFGSKPILSSKADGPDDRLLKDSDLQVDLNEERKSYFYGWQHTMCTEPLHSGEQNVAQAMFHSGHVRPYIRFHAAVKQMKEFSEVFQCKRGDRNYALPDDEICHLYPPVVPSTTAIPSNTISLSLSSRTEVVTETSPGVETIKQPKGAVFAAPFINCIIAIVVMLWV